MFFRTILIFAALSVTAAYPAMADEANDNNLATRLALACPEAEYVQVRDGHITWWSEERETEQARRCLKDAYRAVVADPFPVNMTGYCQATKVSMKRGKIILSR